MALPVSYFKPELVPVLHGEEVPKVAQATIEVIPKDDGVIFQWGETVNGHLPSLVVFISNKLKDEGKLVQLPGSYRMDGPVVAVKLPDPLPENMWMILVDGQVALTPYITKTDRYRVLKKTPIMLWWAYKRRAGYIPRVATLDWLRKFAVRSMKPTKKRPNPTLTPRTGVLCPKCGKLYPVEPHLEFCGTCFACSACHVPVKCPACSVEMCNVSKCDDCGKCPSCCSCIKCMGCDSKFSSPNEMGVCRACGRCHKCCQCDLTDIKHNKTVNDHWERHVNPLLAVTASYYAMADLEARMLGEKAGKLDEAVKADLEKRIKELLGYYRTIAADSLWDHIVLSCFGELRHIKGRSDPVSGYSWDYLVPKPYRDIYTFSPLTREYTYREAVRFNPTEILKICILLFGTNFWQEPCPTYGGMSWAAIALAVSEREKMTEVQFVERCMTLCHNGTVVALKPTPVFSCYAGYKFLALLNRKYAGSVLDHPFPCLHLDPPVLKMIDECRQWGLVGSDFKHIERPIEKYTPITWGMVECEHSKWLIKMFEKYDSVVEAIRKHSARTAIRQDFFN